MSKPISGGDYSDIEITEVESKSHVRPDLRWDLDSGREWQNRPPDNRIILIVLSILVLVLAVVLKADAQDIPQVLSTIVGCAASFAAGWNICRLTMRK